MSQTTAPHAPPPGPPHPGTPPQTALKRYEAAAAKERLNLPAGLTLQVGIDAADAAEKARKAAHLALAGLIEHEPRLREPVLDLLVEFETTLRERIAGTVASEAGQ